MAKIQKISELQPTLSLFSISENYELFYPRFLESDLGKIYKQQLHHFETGEKIKNRIVSIAKNYVRSIVRGKEIKKVEMRSIREYL